MTTIRKIVTSKIDGDNANNTSTSEVRPFGEMAVYVNTDNVGVNKLELLMFDGVRTHLRSKVLSKGTFYGGDADSADQGDGIENFDTIKLIPDAELHYNDGDYGNDQYIVIDPTLPNHIHVRAGGAIDSSTASLFLGGEENNVMVSDSADQVAISTNSTHTWLFGTDGTTTLPANSSILTNETALKIATHSTTTYTFNQAYWGALNGNATRMLTITGNAQYFSCTVTANQDGTYTVADLTGNSFEPGDWFKVPGNELGGATPANDIQINIATVDGEGVILTTTITGTAVGKQWQFGTDGTTTLPQGGTISEVTVTPWVGGNPSVGILLTPFVSDEFGTPNPDMAVKIYPTFNDDDHIHIVAGNPGTVDLFLGDDDQYVKLEQNAGNIVIGTNNDTHNWTFGTDGRLTLPPAGKIINNNNEWTFGTDGKLAKLDGLTLTAGGQFNICTIVTSGSGYNTGNALKATTGGSGTGMTVAIGYGLSNQLSNVDIVDPGTGYSDGDVITVSEGTGGTFVLTRYNELANQGNNNTVEFDWTFGTNGRLTLPGALVKSTVAKTGAINPGIDKVATVSIEPTYDATWANATIVSVGGFSCEIVFSSQGNPTFVNIVDTVGNRTVGDTLATVLGSTLGITGVDGVNDMVIKVATLTTTIATALDLTKSVNKLTNGSYTLANGVEGQIMYLVRQTAATSATVTVANARLEDVIYTNTPFSPFTDGTDPTNMATLIFTDSAWQSMGGYWSFT